jgi:hypothetical protein
MTAPNLLAIGLGRVAARLGTARVPGALGPRGLRTQRLKVPSSTTEVSIGGGYIAGTALLNNAPTQGVRCFLYDADLGTLVQKTVSGADGSYLFSRLYTPRKYRVTLVDPTGTYDPVSADNLPVVL